MVSPSPKTSKLSIFQNTARKLADIRTLYATTTGHHETYTSINWGFEQGQSYSLATVIHYPKSEQSLKGCLISNNLRYEGFSA